MHDGSTLRLHKLEKDYDPTNKTEAIKRMMQSHEADEVLTGVLYLNTTAPNFIDMINMTEQPLATLPGESTRPSREALEAVHGRAAVSSESQAMIEHIARLIRKPGMALDENTPLVSSGLIDSMALVDLLTKLEDVTRLRIPPGKVQPKDMDTVALMFATAQRVGKPRKQ